MADAPPAAAPTGTVDAHEITTYRRLIVPVDGSQASDRVVTWVLENFYRPGDAITLIHVIPTGQYAVLSTDMGINEVIEEDPKTTEAVERNALTMLTEKFTAKLDAAKLNNQAPYQFEITRFATDNDSIGSVVCKRADQLNAAAIIIAKHNRGAIQEFFVGSVTSYLTHHSHTPVVVLHCD